MSYRRFVSRSPIECRQRRLIGSIFFALFLATANVQLPAQVAVLRSEMVTCCASGFSFDSVVQNAKEYREKLGTRALGFVLFIPTDKQRVFAIGGGSGEYSREDSGIMARRTRRGSDHAVLAVSPFGATLHYWDSSAQASHATLLDGKDILSEEVDGVRVAWIEKSFDGTADILLVANGSMPTANYEELAHRAMKRLGIDQGTVLIRDDPHYWPYRHYPPSIPLQWIPPFSTNPMRVSPETVYCRKGTVP